MDIPVSRLNERMAVQVPAELPLGLVFVVGKVENLAVIDEDGNPHEFILLESDHHLRCRLTDRAAHDVGFKDGDLVRAGGHLAFEPQQASYFLLARDVEILEEFVPSRSTLSEIVAKSKQQPQAAGLALAELPTWVKQMAPPEIQEELLASADLPDADSVMEASDSWEALEDTETSMAYPSEEPALAGLSNDLIEFLSEAMDTTDDVEVTSQLISTYRQQNRVGTTAAGVVGVTGTAADATEDSRELAAEGYSPGVSVEDGGFAEQAPEEVLEPHTDEGTPDSASSGSGTAGPEAEITSETTVEDALEAEKLPGEAEASPAERPARRRRRKQERDRVPWFLVVVAIILFLIFLAVMVVGLFLL